MGDASFRALPLASHRAIRALDAAVVVWGATWLVIGGLVGHDLWVLARMGNEGQPGVGTPLIHALVGGDTMQEGGHLWAHSLRSLGVLIGIALAALPTVPALVLYGAFRRRWSNERATLVRRLERPRDASLDRRLAHLALRNVRYERLLKASSDPWADVKAGRYAALAETELARIGITRAAEARRAHASASA